ncbi:ABC transporter permease [Faecalicatena acetigenes]|uniref:ABC transporter permease n=1 Tax=Faecalicatena acetigenes TaxID=2981790 RepID=A0ABT2T9M7_9FIRM|nr:MULTISPECIES: ABC transporter permease [Lachnospiraceae]MCU6746546.1 ABC transporter permease [Faecalicatena acetigenes]SCH23920.1 Oligopeptide transport system permease protein oppB [uncultured Clostridium sp.]
MTVYTIKRIEVGLFSLFVLATVTFALTRAMPGSPFESGNVPESVREAMEEEYGLQDAPLKQYKTYMLNLLKGDWGISYKQQGVTVSSIIGHAAPVTASLGLEAVLLAAVVGTLAGIWQALSKNRIVRVFLSGSALLGVGIPNFAAALLLLLVFGVTLKWCPVTGLSSPAHYVLPVISLAVYPASVTAEMVKQAVREELKKEYVVLARAKGMKFWQVIVFHVLKNVSIPVLNYLGPMSAFLLTGSFAVESIFTIPGLGREFVSSIMNRDYTLIMGLTVFMGSVVIGMNLLTDLLCAWLDPRIRNTYLEKR